jgi:YegS/Rv2252/BmrU family lipid kinase
VKTIVIVNPASGRGRAKKQLPTIERILRASGLDFDLQQSERPWHAAEIAEAAARRGIDAVIAAGGDGTVNEVINGLMRARLDGFVQTALGVLGIGTGNDFAASLNLPGNLNETVGAILRNTRRSVDIGLLKGCSFAEGRYFGNCVGIGFDAAGGVLAEKITWASGLLAYLIAALQNIFIYYKAPTLEIQLDQETIRMPSLLVSVMNGKRIGGGFWTAPDASPDDGLFDLCIAEEVSRPRMLTLLPHFLKGTQINQPEIQMKQTRMVKITATKGIMPIQADGEILDDACREVSIEILPKTLEVIGAEKE